jgi:hypothetical protein
MFEPPYAGIADWIKEGMVIPFLGAGVNTRPAKQTGWKLGDPYLPRGAELSLHLARLNTFPASSKAELKDLAKVASYGAEILGRPWLRKSLRTVFDQDYPPCDIHTYLASIDTPLLIVTTNYDDLTERAMRAAGRPYHLVVHPTDRPDIPSSVLWWQPGADEPEVKAANTLELVPGSETIIYKMHGTVHRPRPSSVPEAPPTGPRYRIFASGPARYDSYVITEDDYIDFLAGMTSSSVIPIHFMDYFQQSQFLFMGYGLNDWNFRVVLRKLQSVLPATKGAVEARPGPSWAIQHRPSPLESKLWKSRGVEIFDMRIEEFIARLQCTADGGGAS